MFEPMFGIEYVQGYTAALLDVKRLFEQNFEIDMKIHKRKKTFKEFRKIIDLMIKGRSILRENPNVFIRCNNNVPDGYEFFDEKRKEVIKL